MEENVKQAFDAGFEMGLRMSELNERLNLIEERMKDIYTYVHDNLWPFIFFLLTAVPHEPNGKERLEEMLNEAKKRKDDFDDVYFRTTR